MAAVSEIWKSKAISLGTPQKILEIYSLAVFSMDVRYGPLEKTLKGEYRYLLLKRIDTEKYWGFNGLK